VNSRHLFYLGFTALFLIPVVSLFVADGQQGFEVGGFFFAVDDGDFYVFEAGVAEEAAYFGFGEAEPDVGVHVARLLIVVAEEV